MQPDQPAPQMPLQDVTPPQIDPSQTPLPESPQPNNTSKKIILIVLGVILLLSMVAGIILLLAPKDEKATDTTDDTTNSQLGDTVQTRMDSIGIELEALGAVKEKDRSQVGVDTYSEEDEKKNTVVIPSDIYVNFPDQDGYPVYDEIVSVLVKNNLTPVNETKDATSGNSATYQDQDIACQVFANSSFARVNCVSKARFLSFKNDSLNVVSATEGVLGVTLGSYYINFYENADKTLTGATISGTITNQEYINTVYLSNSGSGWEYIAQSSRGRQAEIPPECEEFSVDEQALFKEAGILCEVTEE